MAWQPWRKSKAIPPRDVPYGKIERRISGSYLFWESDMAKFKVGDTFRRIVPGNSPELHASHMVGYTAKVVSLNGNSVTDEWFTQHSVDRIELVTPADSPATAIRTVTRREIVPGTYGAIELDSVSPDGSSVFVETAHVSMGASDLRAAAKLFNEIADVLEDGV